MAPGIEDSLLRQDADLRGAIETIDRSVHKIALVVDEERRLLGTVTDGDVRRALLNGHTMDTPVEAAMFRTPVVARTGEPMTESERVARRRRVRKVPLVDGNGRVIGVHTLDTAGSARLARHAVVLMAGGLGTRLRPLTEAAPKPLLEVGNKPLLETIVDRLVLQGFRRFYFAVRYKAEMVQSYFGDGSKWGAEFRYLREPEPLGTAGALGLLPERPDRTLVVMNADLLTKIDFSLLLEFHEDSGGIATMGVRAYDIEIPYGVVTTDNDRITSIEEKPVQQIFVNAGIYALDPAALDAIEPNRHLDMPNLFNALIAAGHRTAAFPVREYWIDIGQLTDYRRANDDFKDEFE